jgi:dienelactone hydrolase
VLRAISAVLALAAVLAAAPAPPKSWLVIAPVDQRGRRPFNPDAIFARYLLKRGSPPPKAGETVRGTSGEQAWRAATEVKGKVAYAYAALECPKYQIVLARLPGGGRIYVNGEAYVGDIYGSGHDGIPVPLLKGTNHIFVRGVRGKLKLEFVDSPNAGIVEHEKGATQPDHAAVGPGGVVAVNASEHWQESFAPLAVRQLNKLRDPKLRKDGEPWRLTFRSTIDGSVQKYALLPASEPGPSSGIVLSLHGAGADCFGQARAYSPKRNLWIVAPTNRRPFGFDWQDWGRQDAYEVLGHALKLTKADPKRVYVTGHSMGGHGTWHLAANDPDRFLAIAPSAGWATFDTYVGLPRSRTRPELWRGADLAGDTLALLPNLAQLPTFILHGLKDDNVPPREAVLMETQLMLHGGSPLTHYQPGAGHWWNGKAAKGADCVDWPGIFELFEKTLPGKSPDVIEFLTADPATDSKHHWIEVLQPLRYGEHSWVRAKRTKKRIEIRTRNVAMVRIYLRAEAKIVIDGAERAAVGNGGDGSEGDETTIDLGDDDDADDSNLGDPPVETLRRTNGRWKFTLLGRHEKRPWSSGPFKRAFDNRFVFVCGNDLESLRRARFEAQMWWYRANGDVEIVTATRFRRRGYKGRNVILFGNASTNDAWDEVLDRSCPIRAENGRLTVGGRVYYGDEWGCLFVYPRKGDSKALVGVFASTGRPAQRAAYGLMPFVSGVGYPDWTVYSAKYLLEGDAAARGGWFNHDWKLPAFSR